MALLAACGSRSVPVGPGQRGWGLGGPRSGYALDFL